MGQGKEMRRVPCTPRDSNSMSHTALRCRCRPLGPGGTCWVQAGSGCLAARVTRSRGGVVVGVAQLVAGRLGHHHLARHMPPGGAGLAASRTPRALRPLTAHTAGLAWCPSTALCLRAGRHRGLRRARRAPQAIGAGACTGAWCGAEYPATKRRTGPTCRCGEVCKAQIEKGGVDTRQCKSKRSKLDEIHTNS